MITIEDIREWLKKATEEHSHVMIICDTFDYSYYPIYVKKTENIYEEMLKYNNINMQKVKEVYNLSMSIEDQLYTQKAFNF